RPAEWRFRGTPTVTQTRLKTGKSKIDSVRFRIQRVIFGRLNLWGYHGLAWMRAVRKTQQVVPGDFTKSVERNHAITEPVGVPMIVEKITADRAFLDEGVEWNVVAN